MCKHLANIISSYKVEMYKCAEKRVPYKPLSVLLVKEWPPGERWMVLSSVMLPKGGILHSAQNLLLVFKFN